MHIKAHVSGQLGEVAQSGAMTPDKAEAVRRAIKAKVAMVGGDEPQ